MYELIKVGEKTYYIDCPAKIGIYLMNNTDVCLIDTGNDKSAAKKVLKHIDENGWTLKTIILTHSHADHIGGCKFLQSRTGCDVFAAGIDFAFTKFPVLESSFLYGGYPLKELRNKFLLAEECNVQELSDATLPEGLEILSIDGHSFSQIAVKTSDDVWFLADCITSEAILTKYHISFLYDVRAYLDSLEKIKTLSGKLFVPAHASPSENICELADKNIAKSKEIIDLILKICKSPIAFEDILKQVFDHYSLTLDINQYVLSGSVIRSYLAYLSDEKQINFATEDNKLLWVAADSNLKY